MRHFYKQLLANPQSLGSVLPSSKYLSQSIATLALPLSKNEQILEIGPGTGVITQALLATGIQPSLLTLLERCGSMASQLEKQLPNVTIIHDDACNLGRSCLVGKQYDLIISSLPLLSMSAHHRAPIISAINSALKCGGSIIQFTYALFKPTGFERMPNITKKHSKIVLLNFPPARVDVLKKRKLQGLC